MTRGAKRNNKERKKRTSTLIRVAQRKKKKKKKKESRTMPAGGSDFEYCHCNFIVWYTSACISGVGLCALGREFFGAVTRYRKQQETTLIQMAVVDFYCTPCYPPLIFFFFFSLGRWNISCYSFHSRRPSSFSDFK